MKVVYIDPFTEVTPRKSMAWYNLRGAYLSFKVDVELANVEIPIAQIERNPEDGGKWRWDTPLFEKEVDELIEEIRQNEKFEAVWLKMEGNKISILDGHHRVAAWMKMGNESIPAVVVTVKPKTTVYL
jgi:ParB-like chromosome segregation protein Spo0J